jgi:hypothetical protein
MGQAGWGVISGAQLTRSFNMPVQYKAVKRAAPSTTFSNVFMNRTSNLGVSVVTVYGFGANWNNTDNSGDDMQVSFNWKADARI